MEVGRDGMSGAAERGVREDRGLLEEVLMLTEVECPRKLPEELGGRVEAGGRGAQGGPNMKYLTENPLMTC